MGQVVADCQICRTHPNQVPNQPNNPHHLLDRLTKIRKRLSAHLDDAIYNVTLLSEEKFCKISVLMDQFCTFIYLDFMHLAI